MRYDAAHKARTRATILAEAARAIRADGPHRLGVADLMARAGLTHGAFYAHFATRDELIAEAVSASFESGAETCRGIMATLPPREALAAFVRAYLSRAHRDMPGTGCPLPALAADLPRLPTPARAGFATGLARVRGRIEMLVASAGLADPEAVASSILAEMVGAVALARALPNPAASDAVLKRSRDAIMARLGLEAHA